MTGRSTASAVCGLLALMSSACAGSLAEDGGASDLGDVGTSRDVGFDGGHLDAGHPDAAEADAAEADAGPVDAHDAGALDSGAPDLGRRDVGVSDGGLPTWRLGLAQWEWTEIQGTSLSNQPVIDPINGGMVTPRSRIDAWNGLSANRDNGDVYLACAGGHADWAGNEVYGIDLDRDQPEWRILRDPTDGAFIVTDQAYYTDGRPSSTHLYYALHFVRSRDRIFKMSAGSVWGSGNGNNNNVDAFDLATNDWDPAGTWAASAPGGGAIDRPYAQDPTTDDTYTFSVGSFRVWTASTGAWNTLAARPSYANDDIVSRSPSAVDPTRQQVLFTRNAYRVGQLQGLLLSFAGTLTDVTFTGPEAAAAISGQSGMEYLPGEDAFLLKSSDAGEVIRIDPVSFEATALATSGTAPPDAVNGVYTRWLYLPRLRGFAYLPHGTANFWFLATE